MVSHCYRQPKRKLHFPFLAFRTLKAEVLESFRKQTFLVVYDVFIPVLLLEIQQLYLSSYYS